jgi:hypothetical protein
MTSHMTSNLDIALGDQEVDALRLGSDPDQKVGQSAEFIRARKKREHKQEQKESLGNETAEAGERKYPT